MDQIDGLLLASVSIFCNEKEMIKTKQSWTGTDMRKQIALRTSSGTSCRMMLVIVKMPMLLPTHMDLRRSGLDEDAAVKHKMIKRSFPTRGDYESTAAGHQLAVANRGQDILRLMETTLEPLKAPGINIYKKVELYTKYLLGGIVPLEFRDDQLYQQPTDEEIRAVNEERKERKIFRDEINEKKSNRVLKDKIMQAVMM